MADLTRIKDPLEIAAASPDQTVRAMALEYGEAKRKVEAYDAFFAMYERTQAAMKPAPSAPKAPAKPTVKAKRGNGAAHVTPREGESNTVLKMILADGPLSLDEIHDRYKTRSPGPARSREAIRVALSHRKSWIGRVSADDNRYRLLEGADAAVAA